jgi:NADH-quinone oxidoreductase subunit M
VYALILIYRAMFGTQHESQSSRTEPLKDLNARELSMLLVLAAGLVWLGLWPQVFLDTSSVSMQWLGNSYHFPLFEVPEVRPMTGPEMH